jgi:hypothetical protein
MSTVIVDSLVYSNANRTNEIIPVAELGHRIVKTYRSTYTGGTWNPNTTFNNVPGMYVSWSNAEINNRLRVSCHIPYCGQNAAHEISHWQFVAGPQGVVGYHSISGNHLEDYGWFVWDIPGWYGGSFGVGYQMRAYADDNHEVRPYSTRYWDGGGSSQNCYGQMIIEEYRPGIY